MSSNNFGRQPVRFTGQHFTKSKPLIREMIQHANINEYDMVLDIGAGKGALTKPLAQVSNRVIAVERDSALAEALKREYLKSGTVKILDMDIRNMPLPNNPFKVVSNIPYNITTDILGMLMDIPVNNFQEGVFTMQWGAALRITESRQTNPRILAWNSWFDIRIIRKVSSKSFHPPPTVESAVVKIKKRDSPGIKKHLYYNYMAFLATLLGQPALLAKDALRTVFTRTQVRRIMKDIDIHQTHLIRDLNIEQWKHCFKIMRKLLPRKIHPSMPENYKPIFKN